MSSQKPTIYALAIAGLIVLSGCSTNPVRDSLVAEKNHATDVDMFPGSQALALRLAETELNEIVFVHNADGDIETEYRVVSEYTAASGSECREILVSGKTSTSGQKDLICQSSTTKWYWPPEIISE